MAKNGMVRLTIQQFDSARVFTSYVSSKLYWVEPGLEGAIFCARLGPLSPSKIAKLHTRKSRFLSRMGS